MFNARDWYWIVGGSTTEVYSSKRNIYVAIDDADYLAWQATWGEDAPQIVTETDIWFYVSGTLPAWLFDGTTFSQPAVGAWTTTQLHGYAVLARYNKEQGGMVLSSGMPIKTDDRAQAKINGSVLAGMGKTNYTTIWHAADGSFWPLDEAAITAMSNQLQTHIGLCFDTSASVADGIDNGTITTLDQIDAAFAAAVAARPS